MRNSRQQSEKASSVVPNAETSLAVAAGVLSAYQLVRKRPIVAAATALGAVGLVVMKQNAQNAKERRSGPYEASASFSLRCPAEHAYGLWRDFENLPRFMPHLKSVTVEDKLHSRWTAAGPFQSKASWRAEIVDEVENEMIAWRSLPGSMVTNRGSIEFRPGPREGSIVATLRIYYSLPGGAMGKGFWAMFGRHPEFTVREDLRRFKAFAETGEVPTTAGQPHGPRGMHGHFIHMLMRETSNMASPATSESLRGAA